MDLNKKYKTGEGIEYNILQMVRFEPEWAANIIQWYEGKSWVSIKERLPESGTDKNGADLGCLAWESFETDCGFQIIVSNREYVRLHPDRFTHWMPLPDPPSLD